MTIGRCKGQSVRLDRTVGLTVLFHALVGTIAGRGCGPSNFSDVPSSVVLSDVVLEGRLTSQAASSPRSTTGRSNSSVWRVDFIVDRVHKGELLFAETAGKEPTDTVDATRYQSVEKKMVADSVRSKVSVMLTGELLRCTVELRVGRTFIVFLRADKSTFRHGHQFYWATRPPTTSTPKRVRDVKKYSCKTCGEKNLALFTYF